MQLRQLRPRHTTEMVRLGLSWTRQRACETSIARGTRPRCLRPRPTDGRCRACASRGRSCASASPDANKCLAMIRPKPRDRLLMEARTGPLARTAFGIDPHHILACRHRCRDRPADPVVVDRELEWSDLRGAAEGRPLCDPTRSLVSAALCAPENDSHIGLQRACDRQGQSQITSGSTQRLPAASGVFC